MSATFVGKGKLFAALKMFKKLLGTAQGVGIFTAKPNGSDTPWKIIIMNSPSHTMIDNFSD